MAKFGPEYPHQTVQFRGRIALALRDASGHPIPKETPGEILQEILDKIPEEAREVSDEWRVSGDTNKYFTADIDTSMGVYLVVWRKSPDGTVAIHRVGTKQK